MSKIQQTSSSGLEAAFPLTVTGVCLPFSDAQGCPLPASELGTECLLKLIEQALSCSRLARVFSVTSGAEQHVVLPRLPSVTQLALPGPASTHSILSAMREAGDTCDVLVLLSANWPLLHVDDICAVLDTLLREATAAEARSVRTLPGAVWRSAASGALALEPLDQTCTDAGGIHASWTAPRPEQTGLAIQAVSEARLCDVRSPGGSAWLAAEVSQQR